MQLEVIAAEFRVLLSHFSSVNFMLSMWGWGGLNEKEGIIVGWDSCYCCCFFSLLKMDWMTVEKVGGYMFVSGVIVLLLYMCVSVIRVFSTKEARGFKRLMIRARNNNNFYS